MWNCKTPEDVEGQMFIWTHLSSFRTPSSVPQDPFFFFFWSKTEADESGSVSDALQGFGFCSSAR